MSDHKNAGVRPAVRSLSVAFFLVWVLVAMHLASTSGRANVLFVSSAGNDVQSGLSPAQALRTIAQAALLAAPGDTVEILSGVYGAPIRPVRSGAPGAPILFRSSPGQRCTVSVVPDTALVIAGVGHITFRDMAFIRNTRPVVLVGATSIRFEGCSFDQTGMADAAYNLIHIYGSRDIRFLGCTFDGGWSPTSDGIRINFGGPQGYTTGLLVQGCTFENFNHYAVNTIGENYHTMLIGNRATENHGTLSFNQGTGRGMVAFNVMDRYVPSVDVSAKGGLGQYFSDSTLVRYNIAAHMQNTGGVVSTGSAFSAASIYDDSVTVRGLRSYNNTVWLSIPTGLRWHFAYGNESSRATSQLIGAINLNNLVVGGLVGTWIQRGPAYTSVGEFTAYNDGNMLWGSGDPIRYSFAGTAAYTVPQAITTLPDQWGPRNRWAYPSGIDTVGDFTPDAGSNVVDAGRHLTAVVAVEQTVNPAWIVVEDPLMFFDGWGSVPGDSLWVAGQEALLLRQGGDTLYFSSPIQPVLPGDSVSVLSAWDGTGYRRVLNGARPDIGGRESGGRAPAGPSGSVGFGPELRRVGDNSLGLIDSVRLNYTGSGLKGLQVTLVNTGLTIIRSVKRGSSIPAASWDFYSRISRSVLFNADGSTADTIRVVLLGRAGAALEPGTYENLFSFEYSTVNIEEPDTQSASFVILEAIGSLARGQNAGISAGGPSVLTVVNITQRGDVNDDDRIDILDLIRIVSHILERQPLSADERLRGDVAPWPGGDGLVDVRDLTLLQTIILTDRYPDGAPVGKPAPDEGSGTVASRNRLLRGAPPEAHVVCTVRANEIGVRLESRVPVVGVQVGLTGVLDSRRLESTPGGFSTCEAAVTDDRLRMLSYDPAGGSLPSGDHDVGSIAFLTADLDDVKAWEVIVVGIDGSRVEAAEITVVQDLNGAIPAEYRLSQNFPNPFNPSTRINFALPEPGEVTVTVYNTVGQQVRTLVSGETRAGVHEIEWDGRDGDGHTVAGGVYFYRMVAGALGGGKAQFVQSKKMILLK